MTFHVWGSYPAGEVDGMTKRTEPFGPPYSNRQDAEKELAERHSWAELNEPEGTEYWIEYI